MRTVDERFVRSPVARIFALARDVEAWPQHLRHYRYVRFRSREGLGGIVEMSANRPFGLLQWPTWWVSAMEVDPLVPVIRYRHVAGITQGMDVEWSFTTPAAALAPGNGEWGTLVRIVHEWNGPAWPLVGQFAAQSVIGPVFIHGIASRTLAGLAAAAERHPASKDGPGALTDLDRVNR
jgi:hypothetical protein